MKPPRGEFALIAGIQNRIRAEKPPWLIRSIGDDCAVLDPSHFGRCVVTTDMLIEGVHFSLDWVHPRLVGRKACLVNVSDIAAMGAVPRGCLLSLAIPKSRRDCFDPLVEGFVQETEAHGMLLVGGDISSADRILLSVTAWGSLDEGEPVFRDGARPGDRVLVVGDVGLSALGLELLHRSQGRWKEAESPDALAELTESEQEAVSAHLLPEVQVAAGCWFQSGGRASAMIDVSDGLASDLMHILEESGVSGELELDRLSRPAGVCDREKARDLILDGGEDYALLITVPADRMEELARSYPQKLPAFREIGQIVKRRGDSELFVTERGEKYSYKARGFDHFL